MTAIIYSRRYNLGFPGSYRLHPFDGHKYGRSLAELKRRHGARLKRHLQTVDRAVRDDELLLAHSPAHLQRMRQRRSIAAALELSVLERAPAWLLRWAVVRPMRWAVRGTVLAARAALSQGFAVNLSGGYHHAKPDHAEGFCLFSDIAVAVRQLRREGLLAPSQRIAYVDLDAHQGNGVCHQFLDDRDVFLFDMYNPAIYPSYDDVARERIDCALPTPDHCSGREYLSILRRNLPGFLDSVARHGEQSLLGIYNAGTDVVEGDPLGGLGLTAEDVLERDLTVFEEFRRRDLPLVMLASGGYTRQSFQLIAASVSAILEFGATC